VGIILGLLGKAGTVNQKSRLMSGPWQRCMALGCLLLVLAFAGLEATHAHSDAQMARSSSPCALCISVHANSPAVIAYALPIVFAVEAVTLPFRAQGHVVTSELTLFIRPPPAF
jgi:hypothetical protein